MANRIRNVTPKPWYVRIPVMMMAVVVFIIWLLGMMMLGYAVIIGIIGFGFLWAHRKLSDLMGDA